MGREPRLAGEGVPAEDPQEQQKPASEREEGEGDRRCRALKVESQGR